MLIMRKLEMTVAPVHCDACHNQIADIDDGIVLFINRWSKSAAPERGTIVHKNCCDSRRVQMSMELSEFFKLRGLLWPKDVARAVSEHQGKIEDLYRTKS